MNGLNVVIGGERGRATARVPALDNIDR